MAKTILHDEQVRLALEKGIDTLTEAVAVILGPRGELRLDGLGLLSSLDGFAEVIHIIFNSLLTLGRSVISTEFLANIL